VDYIVIGDAYHVQYLCISRITSPSNWNSHAIHGVTVLIHLSSHQLVPSPCALLYILSSKPWMVQNDNAWCISLNWESELCAHFTYSTSLTTHSPLWLPVNHNCGLTSNSMTVLLFTLPVQLLNSYLTFSVNTICVHFHQSSLMWKIAIHLKFKLSP